MMRRLFSALTGLLLVCSQAQAQTQCDPKLLNEKLDRYAAQPFSALNWRVIAGLGDPGIDPAGVFDSSWQSQEEYRKLAQSISKSPEPPQLGYDCRIEYPLSVLKSHIAKFGQNDPYVAQWVKIQQQIIAACNQPQGASATLIDPLVGIDAAREAAQRDDRAYQAASIAFYADKAKAVDLFRAIAATSSVHRAAARYNIANLLANAKKMDDARKEAAAILADPSLATVHGITRELQGYIANLEDTASGWSTVIGDAIAVLSRPEKEIAASPELQRQYARALYDIDFAGIRGKDGDWWIRGQLPENPTISKAIVDASRRSPMALWIMGGQSLYGVRQRLSWALTGPKLQQYSAKYAVDVAAISPSGAQMPALAKDVLMSLATGPETPVAALWEKANAAADKAEKSCGLAPETAALPVYLEQAVHVSAAAGDFSRIYEEFGRSPFRASDYVGARLIRQLMSHVLATGNAVEGRRLRDNLLGSTEIASLPENSREAFSDDVARFKAWVAEDETIWREAVAQGSASATSPLLNFMPVAKLWQLGEDTRYTAEERALFARVAWTREYALSRATKDDKLQKMLSLNPRLKESYDALVAQNGKLAPERRQLLFVLRNPRLGLLVSAPGLWDQQGMELAADASLEDVGSSDHNDRNWWCPLEMDRHFGALRSSYDTDADMAVPDEYALRGMPDVYEPELRDKAVAARELLLKNHPMIKQIQWKGLTALSQAQSAPKKLTLAAIAWGKASKGNDGAPEALNRAVNATRYGCNWHGGHGAYSKAAQTLLKTKFAATPFAAQTPYWFDCMMSEWDDKGNRVTSCKPKEWPKQKLIR